MAKTADSTDTRAFGAVLHFAPAVVLRAAESEQLREALEELLGTEPAEPLASLVAKSSGVEIVIGRSKALDCCATLLDAAARAARRGECVAAFALLGIESRLLEQLLCAGETGCDGTAMMGPMSAHTSGAQISTDTAQTVRPVTARPATSRSEVFRSERNRDDHHTKEHIKEHDVAEHDAGER